MKEPLTTLCCAASPLPNLIRTQRQLTGRRGQARCSRDSRRAPGASRGPSQAPPPHPRCTWLKTNPRDCLCSHAIMASPSGEGSPGAGGSWLRAGTRPGPGELCGRLAEGLYVAVSMPTLQHHPRRLTCAKCVQAAISSTSTAATAKVRQPPLRCLLWVSPLARRLEPGAESGPREPRRASEPSEERR